MALQIQIRRDTAANWTSVNPILAQGEIGYELDTGKVKIGDGTTAWTSLVYRFTTITDHTLLSNIGTNTHAQIDAHIANTSNPHATTAAQVGADPAGSAAAAQAFAIQRANHTGTQLASTISDFTESAQDASASLLTTATHDGVSVSYNDAANSLAITNTDKGSSAVTTHVGLADPHPQYLTPAEGNAAYQPLDGDLTAVAALAGAGFAVRTTTNTWATRSLTTPGGSGISITNQDGVFGSPAFTNTDKGSTAVTTHEGLADPHPQYETSAEAQSKVDAGVAAAVLTSNAYTDGVITLKAEKTTTISAGTSLNGGGDLSANRTINHNNFGTAGTYGSASSVPVFVTEATGHVTSVTNTAIQIAQTQVTNLTTDLSGKANLAGGNTFTGFQQINDGNLTLRDENTANEPFISLIGAGGGGVKTSLRFTPFFGRTGGQAAEISGIDDNNSSAHMLFYTAPTGSASTILERARINNDGSFGVGVGAVNNSSALVQIDSTTRGFLLPRMTTAQMEAIATPAAGLHIFNTTLNTVCVFNGTTWIFEYAQFTTATQVSSSTTYANITELVSPVLPAGRYQVTFTGTFQTTATTEGIGLRLSNGTATVGAVVIDWSLTQAGNGTAKNFFYTQVATGSNFTSTAATVANADLPASCQGILQISAAGTMAVQIRTETGLGASCSIRANSIILYRRVS